MQRGLFLTIMAVLLVTVPLQAMAAALAPCPADGCCCRMLEMPDHGTGRMHESPCDCRTTPLGSCHIESSPHVPLLTMVVSNYRSHQTDDLPAMAAMPIDPPAMTHQPKAGIAVVTTHPVARPPSACLLHCTLVI